MKRLSLLLTIVTVLFAFAGCDDDKRTLMSSNYPSDYDINYGLFHVYQYDEVNINGIDLAQKFDFFNTFKLTLHYTDSKISAVTFDNGDVPFHPLIFGIPTGKYEAYLDTSALPNELCADIPNATGLPHYNTIAVYADGEFSITFQLDCNAVRYKYTFKSVANQ